MNKKIGLTALILGALLIIASLMTSVKAASIVPTWNNYGSSNSYVNSGPNGNCNTAVAYWDGLGCRYLNSYYNQIATNWYNANPNTPAEYNPYNKYNNYVDSNGVTHVYSSPAYYTNYAVDGIQYNDALAVASTPVTNNEFTYQNSPANQPAQTYQPADYGSSTYGNSNTFSNSFNTISDSYNANTYNYLNGYNGVYSNSPYYGISTTGYYGYNLGGYVPTYYNYNSYYASSTLPSSYFYYWG